MKVGDLVTLSSYGRSVSRTGWIKKDDIGIVTKIHKVFRNTYYEVSWVKSHDVALIVGAGLYEETFVIAWCSDGYRHRSVARKDIRHVKNNKSR